MWCLRLFGGSDKNRRSAHTLPWNPPKPNYPPHPPISTEPRNSQNECPLFSPRFPAELRIKIYEAVLGDSDRYMHILPFDDQSSRIGRRRCDNIHEPGGPTFQHSCFGRWLTPDNLYSQQIYEFWSDDRLLALLLACHRIYLEAIGTLYTANVFSLKGTRGINAFKSVVPIPQWQMIHHIHVSTMFLTPQRHMPAHGHFPPDNFRDWPIACQILKEMQSLRSLHVQLIMWDIEKCDGSGSIDDDSLTSILTPLNQITVPAFKVEMNISISNGVLASLGHLTFVPVVKERPFNHMLTPISY